MIKIKFFVQESNFVGLNCIGHADYDEYGTDIVCASISTITQSLAMGLMKVLGLDVEYKVDEKNAKLDLRLPENICKKKLADSQILFKTAYLAIEDFCEGYPENIKMEVKTYVY